MTIHSTDFGNGFAWGVASSAYQTEGAYLDDGKGYSIWDHFTAHRMPGQSGMIACDFYNRYIQDLILMQFLNIRNFRFSIAWTRIFPEGSGQANEKGIAFYDELIDRCLEYGIRPWITLYHWDLPQVLEDKGGWTNRDTVYRFCDYAALCMKHFGDRVKDWMVLNEPLAFTGAGYFLGIHAPGRKGLGNFLPAVHHAALAQGMGGQIIRSSGSSLRAGTTVSCSPVDPFGAGRQDEEAAKRVDVLTNRLFIEPLLGLGYPWHDLKVLYQLEKYMQPGDEKLMAFDMDFIGLQNYTREVVRHSTVMPYLNARLIKAEQRNMPRTALDWEIYPEGIYRMLKKFDAYKKIREFVITENGAAFGDVVRDGHVHDDQRIEFYQRYLMQVLKARNEGINVNGYFAWSFTDNFEWAEGYRPRFGLVYVDYATQKRIVKDSGFWFRAFLQEEAGRAIAG